MTRSRWVLLCLLASCAGAPTALLGDRAMLDLRPAMPGSGVFTEVAGCALGACGETGRAARLSMSPRATAVAALYERYLRAVYNRSIDELRAIMADYVAPSDGNSPALNGGQPREVVLAAHLRIFQVLDTGQRPFSALFSPPLVHVSGAVGSPRGLRPRDFWVTGDTTGFRRAGNATMQFNPGMPPNLTLVVRWTNEAAMIVGISPAILAFRP